MLIRAAHNPPSTYWSSSVEIELTCDCHPQHWGGSAYRTGLHSDPIDPSIDRPVYRLQPTNHRELSQSLVVLLDDGILVEP